MHLLYTDESGSVADPMQIYFVVAGVSVYERQVYWLNKELDAIASRFDPVHPELVELHGSPMLKGKKFWRQFSIAERRAGVEDCLRALANSHPSNRIFACVIRKSVIGDKDPIKLAFEQLSSRFDYYLGRLLTRKGDPQKGIMIFDKSKYETTIQALAADYKREGHTWGILKHMAEVPLFLDSKASRLIQLADIVAYAIFQHYENQDDSLFDIIRHRFDQDGGQMHGLYEKIISPLHA